jgi:hypothetical protein
MAFLKRANAVVIHPRVSSSVWGGVRKVASAGPSANLTDQARGILGQTLDPDKYLITHCTIVASVDVDPVPGVKLGTVKVGSESVVRKWDDYYIKPECSQFVNNNGDSWSRAVLKAAYPTFIGAHNFQEHIQIEDQSKGRIIDAVARDIGDSLYVDILVATDRKHGQLVQNIEGGKMATLSMGCTTDFTICTKCGHYAVDETQLCDHIKYAKLNTFMDDSGQKRVIAELCGHHAHKDNPDAPGGVRFIEASWVAVPAFPGAVMRNILTPGEVPSAQIHQVMSSPPPQWSEESALKAATVRTVQAEDTPPPEKAPEEASPLQDAEDSLYDALKARVMDRIQKEISEDNVEEQLGDAMEPNDSIIKEGAGKTAVYRYKAAIATVVKIASSPVSLVEGVAQTNQTFGLKMPADVYRVALKVGPSVSYSSSDHYVQACRKAARRDMTLAEIRVVVRVGSLLSQWEQTNNPITPHSR